jgi:uncharacterized protein YhfF
MNVETADRYWRQYVESLPEGAHRPSGYYAAFYFGTLPDHGRKIAELVLEGTKTASGAPLWAYEAEGKRPPGPGDLSIVEDGFDNPLCIVETTEVRILSLDEVDETFAYDGGEWDRTLATWHAEYWDYIQEECARIGREPLMTAPLVCERFRVIYREPLQTL